MSKRTAVIAEAGAAAPASVASTTPAASAVPVGGWPPDEFTGIGGTYIRDPVTGVRTRVPPEAPAQGEDTAAA